MPNHVYSQLRVSGPSNVVQSVIEFVKDGDESLSADKIIPMPPELRNVSSPVKIVSEQEYAEWLAKPKSSEWGSTGPITAQMQSEYLRKFGAADWYTWANKNWGTKWGFYDTGEWDVYNNVATIKFQTAWSPATPVIEKLASLFPEATILYSFADEGGCFVGDELYKNGEKVEENNYEWREPDGIAVRQLVDYWFEDEEDIEDEE